MKKIADYGFISDCHTAALVDRHGSIDWYCVPRFDSPSVFGRLLGTDAGHWSIRPLGAFRSERHYVGDSLVLRTIFTVAAGRVELTDALSFAVGSRGHGIGHKVPHVLVRRLRGLGGRVPVEIEFAPRFEYGLTIPRLLSDGSGFTARAGPTTLQLFSDVPLEARDGTARARFEVTEGDSIGFAMSYMPTYGDESPRPTDVVEALTDTVEGWTSWADLHRDYEGLYRSEVQHSALVLQGLTYQPSGAIVAAATTSLPEVVGGDANWDYRFAWLRDLSLTLRAQWVAACPDEPGRFFSWIAGAIGRLEDHPVQIMYGIEGERDLSERMLTHLQGFRGSRPVRVGNAAWDQKQLDVMGEVLDAAHLMKDYLDDLKAETKELLVGFADRAADQWREPDAGMWEARDTERHYVSSKVLCWLALDRASRLAPLLESESEIERWNKARDEIHETVLDEGWSERAGSFSGAFGSDELDASVLLMPLVGFLPATDERMSATIARIEQELGESGLIRRWAEEPNGFLITTYWLAECLALAGDTEKATRWFEGATGYANDLGLMTEEADPNTRELLGNFPQAFSHVGLINAAWRLTESTAKGAKR